MPDLESAALVQPLSLAEKDNDILFREHVKEAMLAGHDEVYAIMRHLRLKNGPERLRVKKLLGDYKFLREVEAARGKVESAIIKWMKERGLKYAQLMDQLSKHKDPRVAFQATKDILDRIGTKPADSIKVTGIDQYKILMGELIEEDPHGEAGGGAGGDQAPALAIPKREVPEA